MRANSFRQKLQAVPGSNNGLQKYLKYGGAENIHKKTYKIAAGSDSINIDFLGSNRQSDRLEITWVFDKSDKHTTLYDSYNAELAANS